MPRENAYTDPTPEQRIGHCVKMIAKLESSVDGTVDFKLMKRVAHQVGWWRETIRRIQAANPTGESN